MKQNKRSICWQNLTSGQWVLKHSIFRGLTEYKLEKMSLVMIQVFHLMQTFP